MATKISNKEKKEGWDAYFKSMRDEQEQAKLDYARIMKEDETKTFMDILPEDFKRTKRSIIKRTILYYLDKAVEALNACSAYKGRVFDKKEVVRYMMQGTKYTQFYLAYMFIPKKSASDKWMHYAMDKWPTADLPKDAYEQFEKENKQLVDELSEVEHTLACLTQTWEQYEDRQKVKQGKILHDYDMEKDGYPRTGRGSLCYLFIPVKGKFPKNQEGSFKLFNPRTKKSVIYKILGYKAEDDIYMCENEKGKKVFLTDYNSVAEAWSCLFSSNKEIFAGWWNKVMILK